ncbi:MAG: hypothetical protein ABFC96_06775 [Thermoguttaceae bacterium]
MADNECRTARAAAGENLLPWRKRPTQGIDLAVVARWTAGGSARGLVVRLADALDRFRRSHAGDRSNRSDSANDNGADSPARMRRFHAKFDMPDGNGLLRGACRIKQCDERHLPIFVAFKEVSSGSISEKPR